MTALPFPEEIRRLPPFEGPFDAYRLAAEGCDVLFANYPAGTSIAEHDHPTNNVGVILSGELILIVEGREARFGVGDWYRVPRGTRHGARFERDTSEAEFWFEPIAEP